MRVLFAVVALSMLCGTAFAGLNSATGQAVILDTPPTSVADDANQGGIETDDGNMIAFDERAAVILADGVEVLAARTWNAAPVALPTGIAITSTMILLNSPGSARQDATATFTFAGLVLGVAGDKAGHLERDSTPFFGSPTTSYPGAFNARGVGEGTDVWSIDGNSITVTMAVTEPGDWMRVFSIHVDEDLITDDCHTVELPYEPSPANADGITFQSGDQESATDCVTLSFVCDDLLVCENQMVYTYDNDNVSGQKSNKEGGDIETFRAQWNEATGAFSLETSIAPGDGGSIANSFWLVVSNNANPKGYADQLVIAYADWNAQIVSLYVYNGQNSDNSWEVKHFFGTVPLNTVTTGDLRSWSFTVDGALAEDIANYENGLGGSTEWDGFAIGNAADAPNRIGVWMHASTRSITFDADGKITDYNPVGTTQTWWDKFGLTGVTGEEECL